MPPQDLSEELRQGKTLYLQPCEFCHSMSAATPLLPDLSRVSVMGYDAFQSIVMGGVLETAGMASFADVLSEEDLARLYQAIAAGAHNLPGTAEIP